MQVIAAPALIRGQRTKGASGRLTTSAALAMLLRGTGLRPVESNGVTILRRDQAQPVPIALGTRVPVDPRIGLVDAQELVDVDPVDARIVLDR